MLKELLLQFIVSLFPLFAYQLWFDKDKRWERMPLFMGFFFGASMVLCMLSAPNILGYEIDFGMVPYMVGSLYGGMPALVILTCIYIAVRIPMLDNTWEIISFITLIISFITLMLFAIRPFQRASAPSKERTGFLLMSLFLLLFSLIVAGYLSSKGVDWSFQLVMGFVLAISVTLTATWLLIYMIESVKEKHALIDEIRRVSVNYRNEVQKLQQFIDESSYAVIIIDREGRITHFNELSKKLLAIRVEYLESKELLGTFFPMVFKPGEGDVSLKMLYQALKGTKASMVRSIEGGKSFHKTSITLRNSTNSQITGAAIIVYDVTELDMLRDEVGRMERLSLIGQMAASITHEIRNPMAVIRGFVQLLQERSPSNQQEYFNIIIEELDRANMIISDFLSLAQNRELTMEESSLHDIIYKLLPLLNADANLRGQTIETDFCDDLPLLMLNNREIKQLLLNLIRNGMEAMEEKGVLKIKTSMKDDIIELRITDQGVGIAPDKMKNLFEPFFSTKVRGTGLGLPLCLSIVERHNGRIDVESQEGVGTVFIVTLNCTNSFLLNEHKD